jgi:hypothetical protein
LESLTLNLLFVTGAYTYPELGSFIPNSMAAVFFPVRGRRVDYSACRRISWRILPIKSEQAEDSI